MRFGQSCAVRFQSITDDQLDGLQSLGGGVVTSKAGCWMCFISVLLFYVLIRTQETLPKSGCKTHHRNLMAFSRASSTEGLEEAYLGKLFRSSHAANLLSLANGDLLCFWFSGAREGESNVAIVMSRLAKGSEQWSKTVEIDHHEGRSFQNPVAFQAYDGRVWLLHTSQPAGQGQRNAEVLYLTSDDAGKTWTPPRELFTQPGSFLRHLFPVSMSRKVWLLPMYYTPSRSITDGAESDHSAIKLTNDGGKSWKECDLSQSNGVVQPTVVMLGKKHFLAFFRSRYADFIYRSTSTNGCDWTAPVRPVYLITIHRFNWQSCEIDL